MRPFVAKRNLFFGWPQEAAQRLAGGGEDPAVIDADRETQE